MPYISVVNTFLGMEEKYINGKYWEENETLHEEDSDFKSEHFLTLLKRNPLIPTKKIVDIGCGAGRIIWNFSKEYPESTCVGVDSVSYTHLTLPTKRIV